MPSRLKSLELQGYKTFASRTNFEFAPTITAIVGPNGSGKSNLSDCLRWVLGEQSFSLLRAKKTEDLIFSGSEQRPRASMASATIVFDNADGWLPIDYSEVAITRRAYRDGDNEYLLNGQRVRLKDVSELLAQSGLAERTYTIIGQGLVDAALALKAEERRRLFEEAAGIGLHRSRREEALKRLEATRRNLERVEDILAELQPRLRSLERQARRAQEYEQIKADLRVLLREWYGYHWHRAQQELAEAREMARARENVLERARSEQSGLAERLAAAVDHIQSLRNRLGAWHRQSAQLHSRREVLSRELAVSDERVRSLGEQRKNIDDELVRLEGEEGLLKQSLASAVEETTQLQNEKEEARRLADAARQALQGQQAERSEVEKALQSARQALAALTAQLARLQARQSSSQSALESQNERRQFAAVALAGEEKETLSTGAALAEAARLWQEARSSKEASEERLGSLRRRMREVETARQDALDQRFALEARSARLQAQKDVLEQAEVNLTGTISGGARLLLQAAGDGRLDGVRGILGSLLIIPAEYETAIAAALGEFAEAVLLETGVEKALELLQGPVDIPDGQKGEQPSADADQAAALPLPQAALLPLPEIKPSRRPDAGAFSPGQAISEAKSGSPILEGVIGVAADLVAVNMPGAPPDLRDAVEALLGSVLLVKDRTAARRALEAAREKDTGGSLRVVTLRGEVFFASGPVLVRSGFSEPSPVPDGSVTTPLGRPRHIRELHGQLAETNSQREALDEQISALEQSLGQFRREEELRILEIKDAGAGEERLRSAHREADLAMEKARRQILSRREEQNRLEAESKHLGNEIAQDSAQVVGLEVEIDQARSRLSELNDRLADLSLEELQNGLSQWNTRLAVAERALTEAARRRQERQAALESAQKAQAALRARLSGVQATMKQIEGQKGGLRQEEGELARQIEDLRLQIEPAEAALEEAEREQTRLQTEEAGARQSLSLAEHHHAQARILLARRQEALEGLRRRIEDDADYVKFGLVAFEYADDISGQAPLPLDGMVEQLPIVHDLTADIEENIKRQRAQLRRIGPINPEAQAEYQGVRERFDFLSAQVTDLNSAQADIRQVIAELDQLMEREFRKTFDAVAREFHEIFTRLFDGGSARLLLTEPENDPTAGLTGTGIEIEARLPGRRTQGLALLSGGERSLTAAALVFALLKVSPTPFCVLDEVDAMLDEANVGRYRDLLRELSQNTQFIVVTHNRNTVQVADVIYGVTMGRDSASQVLSLKLDEVSKVVE